MATQFRGWLAASVTALAMTTLAHAQTPASGKFDGTYAGLPSTTSGGERCPQMETPSALTIANGAARSATGNFTGTVDGGGHIILHTKEATRFEGQIDTAGVVKVTAITTKGCSYVFSWRKR